MLQLKYINKSSYSLYSLRFYHIESDRPFTLPSGEYKPKQSLGQNFLSDQNIINNIINNFNDNSEGGKRVVELGPGAGALTRMLYQKYPQMTAIEIDKRSIKFLGKKLPGLNMLNQDVLETDWVGLAIEKGGPLSLIGNLPFNISSQILFNIVDNRKAVSHALFTTQLEVAQRIVSRPRTKDYGILAIVFQLFSKPEIKLTIPSKAFYPVPKVESGLVYFNFQKHHPRLNTISHSKLRKVIVTSFGKRRKILRSSLKGLLLDDEIDLPAKWALKRPEELRPEEFIDLTAELYGEIPLEKRTIHSIPVLTREALTTQRVWRHPSKNIDDDEVKKVKKIKKEKITAIKDEDDDDDDDDEDDSSYDDSDEDDDDEDSNFEEQELKVIKSKLENKWSEKNSKGSKMKIFDSVELKNGFK